MSTEAGKKKELDALEAFDIFDVCEEMPIGAKLITTRWETFQKVTSGDVVSLPESSNSTIPTRLRQADWWKCMRSSTAIRSCAWMRRTHTPTQKKTRKFTAGPGNVSRGTTPEADMWRILGGAKRQLYGRRKAAKRFNQFVVTATDGLGFEQCSEQPSPFRRPGTTLIFELHQDHFYVSGSNVELSWL